MALLMATQTRKDTSLREANLWNLWHGLQELTTNPSKREPTKSVKVLGEFGWNETTKNVAEQSVLVAMIDRMLLKKGFKKVTFDSSNLSHQYKSSAKSMLVTLSAGRLGVSVHVQAC